MPVRLALILTSLLPLGCVGAIVPPSRTELGSTVMAGNGDPQSGVRFATGAHLASGQTRRDADLDVGAGYVFERKSGPDRSVESLALGGDSAGAEVPGHTDAHGMYVELSHVVQRTRGHRSWLGMRGELMRQRRPEGGRDVAGLYARAAWELFATGQGSGAGSTSCGIGAGFAHGTVALGVFLESGVRWVEDEEAAFVAVGGLTVRMPWVGGFVVDLCSWC